MRPLSITRPKSVWESKNPILLPNQPGFEKETGKLKIGNGTTGWNALAYASGGSAYVVPDDVSAASFVTPESVSTNLPTRLSTSELNTAYGAKAPRPGALLAIAIGDSRTMGDTIHPSGWSYNLDPAVTIRQPDGSLAAVGPFEYRQGPRSWFQHACWASNGRLRPLFNAGYGSDDTTGMLRRFQSDVVSKKPDIVFIGDSHNDAVVESVTRSNILAMIQQAQAAGIIVCLYSNMPSNTGGTALRLRRHNAWLKLIAQERRLLFVDIAAAVVDPATGGWLTAMQNDGTHASYLGARAAGQKAIADLGGLLAGGKDWLPNELSSDTNLLTNPLFTSTGTWYSAGAASTITYETDATKYSGRAAVFTVTASGASRYCQEVTLAAKGIAVGDRLKYAGLARVRNSVSGSMTWNLEISAPGVGTYVVRPVQQVATGMDMPEWFYYESEFVVPATSTVIRVGANVASGIGEVSLAQQGLYNLTKLGIATA